MIRSGNWTQVSRTIVEHSNHHAWKASSNFVVFNISRGISSWHSEFLLLLIHIFSVLHQVPSSFVDFSCLISSSLLIMICIGLSVISGELPLQWKLSTLIHYHGLLFVVRFRSIYHLVCIWSQYILGCRRCQLGSCVYTPNVKSGYVDSVFAS